MAFFFREDAKDDINGKRRGRAMHYHDTDNSPHCSDKREQAKQEVVDNFAALENQMNAPSYDRMRDYNSNKYDKRPLFDRLRRSHTSLDAPVEKHHKKMVSEDIIRRGNGNILSPSPLPWNEAKPKIRGHEQLPDEYLKKCANTDDQYKDEQIKNMARCGQQNFFKGFSNKRDKPVGTQKVPQQPLNQNGMGIWGFERIGKMSEENTGGLRKHPSAHHVHHLAPLESQEQLKARLDVQNRPWALHENTNNSQFKTQLQSIDSPVRTKGAGHRNASILNECLQFTDKGSQDRALRMRQERYPDPSTVDDVNSRVQFGARKHGHDDSYEGGIRYNGAQPRQQTFIKQGNLLASPPGAKFASRADTTTGSSYAPRSHSSLM